MKLVLAKSGNNPWWPGHVIETNTLPIIPNTTKIKFYGIDIETYIDNENIKDCSSQIVLDDYKCLFNGSNSLSEVPESMKKNYEKAWIILKEKFKLNVITPSIDSAEILPKKMKMTKLNESFCEICLQKEFKWGDSFKVTMLLSMSENEKDKYISKFRIVSKEQKCLLKCKWTYHPDCVKSINDMVCGCNKSLWTCSFCEKPIEANDLFVCNNEKCMLTYHNYCIKDYKNLFSNFQECPLHFCINCRLDNLSESGEFKNEISLISCIKCKITFHNVPQCLPIHYLKLSTDRLLCLRHLIDLEPFKLAKTGFCFKCCSEVNESNWITCKYCIITYHKTEPCLPGWIEPIDEHYFICNGCKFPFCRRINSPYLILSPTENDLDCVYLWKVGQPIATEAAFNNISLKLKIKCFSKQDIENHLSRAIVISIQNLDHLVCFGLLRFNDMQLAIEKLSEMIFNVTSTMGLTPELLCTSQMHNIFVIHFSNIFPICDNVYNVAIEEILEQRNGIVKCECTDLCTSTINCSNLANNRECTRETCQNWDRCSNRKIQRKEHVNYLIEFISVNNTYVPSLILDENVNKGSLVIELVGEVQSKIMANVNASPLLCFELTEASFLDCYKYCNATRLIQHSTESPNLLAKIVFVSGVPRVGLYANHAINKGEKLTIDFDSIRYKPSNERVVSDSSNYQMPLLSRWNYTKTSTTKSISISNDNVYNRGRKEPKPAAIKSIKIRDSLCPVCLQDVTLSLVRPLIHCRECYMVFHIRCAANLIDSKEMSINELSVSKLIKDPRIRQFVCLECKKIQIKNN